MGQGLNIQFYLQYFAAMGIMVLGWGFCGNTANNLGKGRE